MTKNELVLFAKEYTSEDFIYIEFDDGENSIDINYEFRLQLCEAIKEDLMLYQDQLILDVYVELAKSAKVTYSVYKGFHLFANEILERGGIRYFEQYMKGASQSMDTLLSSARLNLSKQRITEILEYIQQKLAIIEDADMLKTYNHMFQRFEWLANK